MTCRFVLPLLLLAALGAAPASAAALDPAAVERASFAPLPKDQDIHPLTVKVQILLDRAGFSPGEIDGRRGENLDKALRAFAEAKGLAAPELSPELFAALPQPGDGLLADYTVTAADVRGPYLDKVPTKLDDMKGIRQMGYGSVREALAERFHMSEALLVALNPGADLRRAGTRLRVPNVTRGGETPPQVARIDIDKQRQTLKAYGRDGALLLVLPATVGSEEKPSPDGTLKVTEVHANPFYRYDPDYRFKGVKAKRAFMIRPGPNNPVGSTWIGLSEQGYGIHGTPEPGKVSKAESHGCVRLTNWDAARLARMVKKGVSVAFVTADATATAAPAKR
jgi:lipoprotein-anchoring transpeptidase ErfK/SrfK